MPFDSHSNLAKTTAANSPGLSGTALNVAAGEGALFGAAPFNCFAKPNDGSPLSVTNTEYFRVTDKGGGDDWTIVRAQEGSAAIDIQAGYLIGNPVSAKNLTDIETALAYVPKVGSGDPNGSVTGLLGQLYVDTATLNIWRNSDGATAWV